MSYLNIFDSKRGLRLAVRLTAACVFLLGASLHAAQGNEPIKPRHVYLSDAANLAADETVSGPARVLELKGRKGINPTSIHSAIKLAGGHTLNEPQGTVVIWFFTLEDLTSSFLADHMKMDNKFFATYPFLSDFEMQRDVESARFSIEWNRHNELRAKFFEGNIYPSLKGFAPPQKAWVQAVPFSFFQQHHWYQLAVTWDDAAKSASLFVNGVLLGKSDVFNQDFHRDKVGDTLFAGCPAICVGQTEFYDAALNGAELYRKFRAETPDYDSAIEKELRHSFEGADLKNFTFKPDANWTKQMDLDFKNPVEQIKHFYIQGLAESVKPTGSTEGLLIETPDEPYGTQQAFPRQVYIWSYTNFEGNIYVEFEWKSLRPGGLALLMINASGMGREDFMADYPKKTKGEMQTVFAENVRNYHWEFYREMNDVRNDTGTSFSRKNPFSFRNGFGSAPEPFAQNEWHKAQIVARDGKVRAAVDGKILLEFDDNSRINTGTILNYGHIAIRCMIHTKVVFRNLKVYTEKLPFTEVKTFSAASATTPQSVLAMMERVASWQLANPSKHPTTDWTQGAGSAGMMALADISKDAKYRDAMITLGETNNWKLGHRKYFADDHAIGQMYLELYLKDRDAKKIAPLKAHFDDILANPPNVPSLDNSGQFVSDAWSWCDALFMGPPVWMRLYAATGDARYRNFAVTNWWRTSDYLYDTEEHLFFRDSNYFEKREANGRKVFWSRGNGWVMSGLVRVLQFLPKNDPDRARFETQFKQMAGKILTCQQPDGLWRASLLDPASYPRQETSGSAFHTYALAWGVNQGLLDRATFEPALIKAWSALVSCVQPDGKLTHVQPIGADPKHFDESTTEVYGVGAFLLAGSEVYRLAK